MNAFKQSKRRRLQLNAVLVLARRCSQSRTQTRSTLVVKQQMERASASTKVVKFSCLTSGLLGVHHARAQWLITKVCSRREVLIGVIKFVLSVSPSTKMLINLSPTSRQRNGLVSSTGGSEMANAPLIRNTVSKVFHTSHLLTPMVISYSRVTQHLANSKKILTSSLRERSSLVRELVQQKLVMMREHQAAAPLHLRILRHLKLNLRRGLKLIASQ